MPLCYIVYIKSESKPIGFLVHNGLSPWRPWRITNDWEEATRFNFESEAKEAGEKYLAASNEDLDFEIYGLGLDLEYTTTERK